MIWREEGEGRGRGRGRERRKGGGGEEGRGGGYIHTLLKRPTVVAYIKLHTVFKLFSRVQLVWYETLGDVLSSIGQHPMQWGEVTNQLEKNHFLVPIIAVGYTV